MQEDSLGIVIGTIESCSRIEKTKRLYHIVATIGSDKVSIASALPSFYPEGYLLGKQVPLKVDVNPVEMYGVRSSARFIAIKSSDGSPVLLMPESMVDDGAQVT
jgi:EMAP domain